MRIGMFTGGLLALAMSVSACVLLVGEFSPAAGTGGSGATSSKGTGGGINPSTSSSGSSASGTGGFSTASTSGTGGHATATSTAAGSAASSSTASSSSSSGVGGCTIDDDQDGVLSWMCNPANPNDPTKDCGDEDPLAHPNATAFQASPISGTRGPNTAPYDFNCNGVEEPETKTVSCSGAVCSDTTTIGFAAVVPCGSTSQLGTCGGALPCKFQPGTTQTTQRCK